MTSTAALDSRDTGGPEVAVVVSARNAERTIGDLLDALRLQEEAPRTEVVIVDNVSTDSTAARAQGHPLQPKVIRRTQPAGPGVARNAGVAATTAPFIAFTDADCVPTRGWLAAGTSALAEADIVQGQVRSPPDVPVGPFDHTLWVLSDFGLYPTANLFLRRADFERVGGFSDWAEMNEAGRPQRPFGEDTLLAWRIIRLGRTATFSEAAEVRHAVLPGDAASYLNERRREVYFAGLVRQVPELRNAFLWRRLFLDHRTAAFDLSLISLAMCARLRSPLPLVGVIPWLRLIREEATRRGDSRRVRVYIAWGDALSFAARMRGCVRYRTAVL